MIASTKYNTKVDNAKDLVVVMPVYNMIEYRNNNQNHQEVYGSTTRMVQMLTTGFESAGIAKLVEITVLLK